MWRIIWALFAIICFYQWLDAYQTYLLINLGATEANPLMAWSINQLGIVPGLLIPKLIVASVLGIGLFFYQRHRRNYE